MAKISVIVPVYKVEDYLASCLDSIAAQTLRDIEVICVNDGSPDNSREIAQRYSEQDSRFLLVDKENGGLSSARNTGIDTASSPYICFVDSDDQITPDACEKIVRSFEKTDADVVTFGATCHPKSEANRWLVDHLNPRDIKYEGFKPDLLFKEMSHPFAWRTACKRDFLVSNQLYFEETVLFGEDQVFHFAIYPRSSITLLMSDKLYLYQVNRQGSLMQRIEKDQAKKMLEHVNIMEYIFSDWSTGGFLKQYPAEIIEWSVEFALYGISRQNEPLRSELLKALHKVWFMYFSKSEIESLELLQTTKLLVTAALSEPHCLTGVKGKWLQFRYYLKKYGVRHTVARILGYPGSKVRDIYENSRT